jgi:hypothetical protein
MKRIILSTNRVASCLNNTLKTKHYNKGSLVNVRTLLRVLISDDTSRESKKVFLNQLIDVSSEQTLVEIFSKIKNHTDLLRSLVDEVKQDLVSGEWDRKEREFEENFQKIQRRKDIIGGIE